MNPRAILKQLFLTITLIISTIYMFITSEAIYFDYSSSPLYLIPITFLIIMLKLKKKKRKHNKIFQVFFILICLLNILLAVHYLYTIITDYIKWNSIQLDFALYYLIILYMSFLLNIFNLKKETNQLNDILTIITCLIISAVHYRYYIDSHFLHNLVNIDNAMTGSTSYAYINQYYSCFVMMYLTLLIHQAIQTSSFKHQK